MPGTVEKDVTHPGAVRISEGKFLPGNHLGSIGIEDAIYDTKSGFQVRVPPVVPGPHVLVQVGDRLEDDRVGFATDALALNDEVEEGLGTEVGLIPQLGDHHETS